MSLDKVDTELSADCIEFCPHDGFHDIFVCGTYQVLTPKSGSSGEQTAWTPELTTAATSTTEGGDGDSDEEIAAPKPTQRTGRLLLYRIGEDRASLYVIAHMLWLMRQAGNAAHIHTCYFGCEMVCPHP